MMEGVKKQKVLVFLVLVWLLQGRSFGQQNAVSPGDLKTDPPTIKCLGFRWLVSGDDNGNATCEVKYRKKGDAKWLPALAMMRVNREIVDNGCKEQGPCGNYLAGSIFNLSPETEYEVNLKLADPDGGGEERSITATTRIEPPILKGKRQVHVYPDDYTGTKKSPNFENLSAAVKQAQPGDIVLLHKGTYKGTFELGVSGTETDPIVFRSDGDGEAIIDGKGTGQLLGLGKQSYLYFEGLTLQNGEYGISSDSSKNVVVRRCKIVGCSNGAIFLRREHEPFTENWYIADNIITGTQVLDWTQRVTPEDKGIVVTGKGHIVCYNTISMVWDGISTEITGWGEGIAELTRLPDPPTVANDIYNNDISKCRDDMIDIDYSIANVRVFDNRLFNCATHGLSAQPSRGGPNYLIRNVVYNSKGPLKLHNIPSGVVVLHNTFVTSGHFQSRPAKWHQGFFRNNLFLQTAGYGIETGSAHKLTTLDYDGYRNVGHVYQGERYFLKWTSDNEGTWYRCKTLSEFAEKTGHEKHGIEVDYDIFVNAGPPDGKIAYDPNDTKSVDLQLKPGSKAVDKGLELPNINENYKGKAPDIGCYEQDQPVPHYGPRPVGKK